MESDTADKGDYYNSKFFKSASSNCLRDLLHLFFYTFIFKPSLDLEFIATYFYLSHRSQTPPSYWPDVFS